MKTLKKFALMWVMAAAVAMTIASCNKDDNTPKEDFSAYYGTWQNESDLNSGWRRIVISEDKFVFNDSQENSYTIEQITFKSIAALPDPDPTFPKGAMIVGKLTQSNGYNHVMAENGAVETENGWDHIYAEVGQRAQVCYYVSANGKLLTDAHMFPPHEPTGAEWTTYTKQ